MRNSIASLKQSLTRIALDVHGDEDDVDFSRSLAPEDDSVSDRRVSQRFAQSNQSPDSNGNESNYQGELDHYKAEVERLKASESEIKRLSVNYAAILREREEELSHLHKENNSLRKSLESASITKNEPTNESLRKPADGSSISQGDGNQSPTRATRQVTQANSRVSRSHAHATNISKNGEPSNGTAQPAKLGELQTKHLVAQGREEELADLLDHSKRELETLRADQEASLAEKKHLGDLLKKEGAELANMKLQLQGERNSNESLQKELHSLKADRDRVLVEMKELQNVLHMKRFEVEKLQSEVINRGVEESNQASESMSKHISSLEKENADLKNQLSKYSHEEESATAHLGLEQKLKDAYQERDKAKQEVARLKKHLLDKHFEESEKMDADSKLIEDLKANCEFQRTRILQLESSLKQSMINQEELKKTNGSEVQRSNEIIKDLKQKVASCMITIDAKNVELQNLQTALGQFYAESEAKERLVADLAASREDLSRMSGTLREANQRLEASKKEKDDLLLNLSQAERKLLESNTIFKMIEEENLKLKRALEQSMTRINRMSVDSDYYVDRRIVIKLLVTYLERNHNKEVLDLMVRMLGFSDEDKTRIGLQQAGGKGVVRGVLALPGRLVGGILGGGSSASPANAPSDNQSFADLWVDFLLKETQERERREAAAGAGKSSVAVPQTHDGISSTSFNGPKVQPAATALPWRGLQQFQQYDSEFSNVPLNSSRSSYS